MKQVNKTSTHVGNHRLEFTMLYLAAVDPGITPNTNFPFLESLKEIGGGILVGAFIVIAIVAAAVVVGSIVYSKKSGDKMAADAAL